MAALNFMKFYQTCDKGKLKSPKSLLVHYAVATK